MCSVLIEFKNPQGAVKTDLLKGDETPVIATPSGDVKMLLTPGFDLKVTRAGIKTQISLLQGSEKQGGPIREYVEVKHAAVSAETHFPQYGGGIPSRKDTCFTHRLGKRSGGYFGDGETFRLTGR